MADGSARITFDWADGPHTFRLALEQLRTLQEATKTGPYTLWERVALSREWRVDDIRETIRLGLIGGGMEPLDALALVRVYVDGRPLVESVAPAERILRAALIGADDDPVGKAGAERPADPTAGFGSPPFTAPAS